MTSPKTQTPKKDCEACTSWTVFVQAKHTKTSAGLCAACLAQYASEVQS